jgi:hypothetical protein
MQKEKPQFGEGASVSVMQNPDFEVVSDREQALIMAWANGCSKAVELTDPANVSRPGPKGMLERYAQVNFWFTELGRLINDENRILFEQLVSPVARIENENAGKYEPESTPEDYQSVIPPMGALAGYALPRIFVEHLGLNAGLQPKEVQDRLISGFSIVSEAAKTSATPIELLARTADGIIRQGNVSSEQVLDHILSRGWLEEHHAQSMVDEFKAAASQVAPDLWDVYTELSDEDKTRLDLV